jgi:hypothetical protein
MARYSATVRDQNASPIVGVKIYVTTQDGSVAVLTDDNGDPLVQPLISDDYGGYFFNADLGYYDLSYYYGGRLVLERYAVSVGGPNDFPFTVIDIDGRRDHLPVFDSNGNINILSPLVADTGVVTVAPSGEPILISFADLVPGDTGNLDGGDANVSGDGTGNLDGGTA